MENKYEVKDCIPYFHKWTLWTKWISTDYSEEFQVRKRKCLNCGKENILKRRASASQFN